MPATTTMETKPASELRTAWILPDRRPGSLRFGTRGERLRHIVLKLAVGRAEAHPPPPPPPRLVVSALHCQSSADQIVGRRIALVDAERRAGLDECACDVAAVVKGHGESMPGEQVVSIELEGLTQRGNRVGEAHGARERCP